jgi:protein SCO1/2
MTKTKTLIILYTCVALICAGILSVVNFIILPRIEAKKPKPADFMNVVQEKPEKWHSIEKDLVATNQAGEKVKLSDLRGKVWVVAEFFAVCPHCAVRNGTELRAIYDKFKDHPDFHIVCISVDPTQDDVEKLKSYSGALNADVSNWWFLNAGDEKATHEYLEKTMKFFAVRERANPLDIESNGRFEHDLGIMLVDRDFTVIGKWALADARSEKGQKENPGLYDKLKKDMFDRISRELNETSTPE